MSTKKTEKSNGKKSGGESHEEPQSGRVHTIANARPTPVTRAPKDKPAAVAIGDEPAPALTSPTATLVKRPKKAKGPAMNAPTTPPDDSQEVCVFAFRLTRGERDEIHAATGSARASKFVKAIVLAGARGDVKAVTELMDETQAGRK